MSEELKELIKTTELLAKITNNPLPLVDKWDAIEQLTTNLHLIKENMDKDKFDKKFGVLYSKVKRIQKRISDPEFVKSNLEKIEKILSTELTDFKKLQSK